MLIWIVLNKFIIYLKEAEQIKRIECHNTNIYRTKKFSEIKTMAAEMKNSVGWRIGQENLPESRAKNKDK